MATFTDFITYWENIAKNHKSIKHTSSDMHFCRLELEEVLSGLKSELNYPALIVETYDWRMQDLSSDNVLKQRTCGVMVLDRCDDRGNFSDDVTTLSTIESIIDDILTLIRHHRDEMEHNVVMEFDMNTIDVVPVIGTFDNLYGFRIVFDMKSGFNPDIDTTKWITTNF